MVEIAVRILRTPRGTYQLDQTFGVDMSGVKTITSGTAATFQAAIYQAFDMYIKRGFITKFKASVSLSASGALTYDVSFLDPRAQLLIGITGP
jgi:phage baseplate assembly protein W